MVTCCAFGCTNRSKPSKPGVTFHRFPTNHLRPQWINAIRRKDWNLSAHSRICSEHFVESDFDRTLSRVRIKDHVVPSVFKNFPKYLQQKKSCRKPTKYLTTRNINLQVPLSLSQQDLSSNLNDDIALTDEVVEPSPSDSLLNDDIALTDEVVEPSPSDSLLNDDIALTDEVVEPSPSDSLPSYTSCLAEPLHVIEIPDSVDLSPPSPSKDFYKWKLKEMEQKMKKLQRKVKTEKQKNRRQKKKIVNLSIILSALQKQQFMSEDDFESLSSASAPFAEILSRLLAKKRKKMKRSLPKKLRSFALNLHYYSPRAYNYVRKTFISCLPHPKTISKWYSSVKCQPGFTEEAFECLKRKSEDMPAPVCSLILDEMAIRKHPCFDGKICHGYIDFGGKHDDSQLAKEALVFMVVSLNYDWKIPVGYFLLDGITSYQKANLVEQCLKLLHEAKTNIVSLTFDGLKANISMATNLGCNLRDIDNMVTTFPHPSTGEKIAIFLDPCHMLKLIRNCLGEKKVIFDHENKAIEWKYIANLFDEQTKQGLHLGNKIKSSHILYFKQKMKVSLATQTLSDSVAHAMEICDRKLKLKEFDGCQATVKFIKFFNKLFDLFNSRSMKQLYHKQPVSRANLEETVAFLKEADSYINGLRVRSSNQLSESILLSNRKTGFLGFKICILSLLHLIEALIQKDVMEFIPLYRLSQDHLELFFSQIRFMGGANNNPTARQFKAAYRKLLIHSEIQNCTTGNCISLEEIPILTCSSSRNSSDAINPVPAQQSTDGVVTEFPDHDYATHSNQLSEFIKECIAYMSGSIVRRISKTLKCDVCLHALYGEADPTSLTSLKSKGRLSHPSIDVIEVCKCCESIFRLTTNSGTSTKLNVLKFTNAAVNSLDESSVFESLETHICDKSPINNHRRYLIKEIAHCFFQARIGHFSKRQIDSPSIRNICTKIPLFKGQ